MEIEFKLRNKEVVFPLYSFFSNKEKDFFILAIPPKDADELIYIKNEIEDSKTKVGYEGRNVFFETENKIYYFQLEEDFEYLPIKKDFKICVGFVEPTDETELIKIDYKKFTLNINNDE